MKTKTKSVFTFSWQIAFYIMLGLFLALLFYTVVFSLQVRAGIKHMLQKNITSSQVKENTQVKVEPTLAILPEDLESFRGAHFSIQFPKNWKITSLPLTETVVEGSVETVGKKYPSDPGYIAKYKLIDTTSGRTNIGRPEWQSYNNIINIAVLDKSNKTGFSKYDYKQEKVVKGPFPETIEERIRYLSGGDIQKKEEIIVNGKKQYSYFGASQIRQGWFTLVENDRYVVVYSSTHGIDDLVEPPSHGQENLIFSSIKVFN